MGYPNWLHFKEQNEILCRLWLVAVSHCIKELMTSYCFWIPSVAGPWRAPVTISKPDQNLRITVKSWCSDPRPAPNRAYRRVEFPGGLPRGCSQALIDCQIRQKRVWTSLPERSILLLIPPPSSLPVNLRIPIWLLISSSIFIDPILRFFVKVIKI